MSHLELKSTSREDRFIFHVDVSKVDAKKKRSEKITIVFSNCKFSTVIYSLNQNLGRKYWEILGEINNEISRLEKDFEKEIKKIESNKKNLKYRKMNE